jgi:hypothetical protein
MLQEPNAASALTDAPATGTSHFAKWHAGPHFERVLQRWSAIPTSLQQMVVFILVACVHFYFACARNDRNLYYDAREYWYAASNFSLGAYTMPLRGYSYPFFCLILRTLAKTLRLNEFIVIWSANSLIAAAFGTLLVPGLVRRLLPQARFGWQAVLAFNAILLSFYRGYTSYPLTDIPALALLVLGLQWLLSSPWLSLLGGTALALSINVRPIYLISLVGLVPLICWRLFTDSRAGKGRAALVWLSGLLVGLCLGFAPQVYINHRQVARYSILPPTDQRYGKSLYLWQIEVGLGLQRYETNVGTAYPQPQVRFHDRVGTVIASSAKTGLTSYADWLRLWTKYPRSLVALYGRHFFNGLDVSYPTPYLRSPYTRPLWGPLLNYSLIFLFLVRLRHMRSELIGNVPFIATLACLLSPVAASIPTALEVRFFLPVHSVIFASVAFSGVLALGNLRRIRIVQLVYFLLFLLMCITLSDTTYGSLEYLRVLR